MHRLDILVAKTGDSSVLEAFPALKTGGYLFVEDVPFSFCDEHFPDAKPMLQKMGFDNILLSKFLKNENMFYWAMTADDADQKKLLVLQKRGTKRMI